MRTDFIDKKIHVKSSCEYDVIIGRNLLKKAGKLISGVINPCKAVVITDDIVDRLYSETVINSLNKEGFKTFKHVFSSGEQNKNLETYSEILDFMANSEITRTDIVVALGGGVVGDIAGFVATTYLRGIKFVQIPTTLLAQIDSSVGGKTGIDLNSAKNLVGAFHQPSLVICDIDALSTLSERLIRQGMGEVAKYAILDEKIFNHIEYSFDDLDNLVYLCVDYKRKVVEEDEFECGNRRLLNLGHTVAHGIEVFSGFKISHGDAVSMGVKVIINNSYRLKYISKEECERMLRVANKCSDCVLFKYTMKEVLGPVVYDKKRSGDNINLVMIHGVGDCRVEKVKLAKLAEYLV